MLADHRYVLFGLIIGWVVLSAALSAYGNASPDEENLNKIVSAIYQAKTIEDINTACREYQAFIKTVSDQKLKKLSSKRVLNALADTRDTYLSEYRVVRKKKITAVVSDPEHKQKLTKKRTEACTLIATYKKIQQPQVDALVGEVRALYYGNLPAVNNDKQLAAVTDKITAITKLIVDMSGKPAQADSEGYTDQAPPETADSLIKKVVEDVEKELSKDVLLSKDAKDALKFNEQYTDQLSVDEYEVVVLTNEYRLMMGKQALKIDLRLNKAARKHSKNMKELKFFSHTSLVKGQETFEMRAGAEGGSAKAENIATNSTGHGAFSGWYHSPGHHKNMLITAQGFIGIGQFEELWTEMLN
ncbi:MAG: CAP domain-containing protein [Planctomycetota bacterium]